MKPAKSISVVIPNYNGRSLLEKNLPSVFIALENTGLAHEIVIADDASSDDSVAFVRNKYPSVVLVEASTNGGFAANINRGIFKAKYDLLLLLNSDVSLESDYFRHQLRYFDLPDTFSVMGKLLPPTKEDILDRAVYPRITLTTISSTTTYTLKPPLRENFNMPAFTLSGANGLVSREKLIILGGFNETFSPYYREDFELGLRAWRLGWKSYYEGRSVCYHEASSTINKYANKKFKKAVIRRNKLILHYIHLRGNNRVFWFAVVIVNVLFRVALFDLTYYRALAMFAKNFKDIKASRTRFYTLCNTKQPCLTVKEAAALFKVMLTGVKITVHK